VDVFALRSESPRPESPNHGHVERRIPWSAFPFQLIDHSRSQRPSIFDILLQALHVRLSVRADPVPEDHLTSEPTADQHQAQTQN
jgi:hypothetical protein